MKTACIAVALPLAAVLLACAATAQKRGNATRNSQMKTVVNELGAEISVTPRVKKAEELKVTVVLSNEGARTLRINGMYLYSPSLMLRFQDSTGARVPTGPPPVPDPDDGVAGRFDLAPGKSVTYVYEGREAFGTPLEPGEYKVRFRYKNAPGRPGEWVGTIETPPEAFTVVEP